jgi:hypothetical protein
MSRLETPAPRWPAGSDSSCPGGVYPQNRAHPAVGCAPPLWGCTSTHRFGLVAQTTYPRGQLLYPPIHSFRIVRFCYPISLCETSNSCCHGHTPPSVGPCLLHPLSQTVTPLLPPLPGFIALMGASDFRPLSPSSLLFTLVRGYAAPSTPPIGSPWLPPNLTVKLDAASDPGLAPCARL